MCSECSGIYPDCPVCSIEPTMIECYECNGLGHFYYDSNGIIITKGIYDSMQIKEQQEAICDICETCNGFGSMEYDSSFDYLEFDDYDN